MADLSAQVVSALEQSNIKGKVVLLDFSGPGLEVHAIGSKFSGSII